MGDPVTVTLNGEEVEVWPSNCKRANTVRGHGLNVQCLNCQGEGKIQCNPSYVQTPPEVTEPVTKSAEAQKSDGQGEAEATAWRERIRSSVSERASASQRLRRKREAAQVEARSHAGPQDAWERLRSDPDGYGAAGNKREWLDKHRDLIVTACEEQGVAAVGKALGIPACSIHNWKKIRQIDLNYGQKSSQARSMSQRHEAVAPAGGWDAAGFPLTYTKAEEAAFLRGYQTATRDFLAALSPKTPLTLSN